LSRERIARAGLELADRDGVEALSMRRLADELGAGTMTLYGHFTDKRELLDAVIEAAVAEQQLPRFEGSWRDQIRQLGADTREMFARHPSVVEIWARQPVLAAGTLHGVEAGLQILEEAGFEAEEAVKAFRLLVTYAFGFELFSVARSNRATRESVRAAFGALPPGGYPRLSEAAGAFAAAMAGEEAFAYGLDRILDGLEASLRRAN
jgi:AcrR family transcriptional regulator